MSEYDQCLTRLKVDHSDLCIVNVVFFYTLRNCARCWYLCPTGDLLKLAYVFGYMIGVFTLPKLQHISLVKFNDKLGFVSPATSRNKIYVLLFWWWCCQRHKVLSGFQVCSILTRNYKT